VSFLHQRSGSREKTRICVTHSLMMRAVSCCLSTITKVKQGEMPCIRQSTDVQRMS
jgi:hypothetical protein